jgi:isopenicillin N synthase-like dioxygenase
MILILLFSSSSLTDGVRDEWLAQNGTFNTTHRRYTTQHTTHGILMDGSHLYLRSSLSDHRNLPFALSLKHHGYAILSLDQINENERECFLSWEQRFSKIFQQTNDEKERISQFDSIQGQTMGYRREGFREFLETRLQGQDLVLPTLIEMTEFHETVKIMWGVLREIVVDALSCMAHLIGIDPSYFLELIDQDPLPEGEVSSTVLRICSYPFDINHTKDNQISFGAHTDTSFITIGTFSSTSGLEIQDLVTQSWLSIEEQIIPNLIVPQVAVFVGDVMQLLTRNFFTATVHRVRTYHRHPLKDPHLMTSPPRVSCPFIVRGRHKTKIRSIQHFQRFLVPSDDTRLTSSGCGASVDGLLLPPTLPSDPIISQSGGDEDQRSINPPPLPAVELPSPLVLIELPDFEDLNMKLVHTLLDRKRQKCLKQNQDKVQEGEGGDEEREEWVLKAFYE